MIIPNDSGEIKVTVSIGVTEFSDDVDDYKELIERADQALYQFKRAVRNRITIYTRDKKTAVN